MVPWCRLSLRSLSPKAFQNVSCRLDRNRRLFFDFGGDRLLEFETAGIFRRLFFGRAKRRVVCDRGVTVCVEYRLRTHRWLGWRGSDFGHRDGSLGTSRLGHDHAGVGVRALLLHVGRIDDAGVFGTTVWGDNSVDFVSNFAVSLCVDQSFGDRLCRRLGFQNAVARNVRIARKCILGRSVFDGRADRCVYGFRWDASGVVHRHRTSIYSVDRIGSDYLDRPRQTRWLDRTAELRG